MLIHLRGRVAQVSAIVVGGGSPSVLEEDGCGFALRCGHARSGLSSLVVGICSRSILKVVLQDLVALAPSKRCGIGDALQR
jgi:hypothetical protein